MDTTEATIGIWHVGICCAMYICVQTKVQYKHHKSKRRYICVRHQ